MTPRKAKEKRKLRSNKLRDNAHDRPKKTGRMFRKITRALKSKGSAGGAELFFVGGASRIMRVHQYGLTDNVEGPGSAQVRYPVRQVLGFAPEDRVRLLEKLTALLD